MNESFLVAYDGRELHQKLEIKLVKYGYVRSCPKKPAIHIGSLEILGDIFSLLKYNFNSIA
jgi:hypothetical protein